MKTILFLKSSFYGRLLNILGNLLVRYFVRVVAVVVRCLEVKKIPIIK